LHAVPLAHASPLAHAVGEPVEHEPSLLQVPAAVSIPAAHTGPPHAVLDPGYSHEPSEPHPVAPHVPPVLHAAEQQLPVPAVPQTPLAHERLVPHDWPALRRHWVPPTQVLFAAHPVLGGVHEVAHAVPLEAQAKPLAHAAAVGVVHPPVPLHELAGVRVALVQEAGAQLRHRLPFDPQALLPVPETHVPAPPSGLEQHPPAQGVDDEHVVSQTLVVVSHATSVAQSPLTLHPHVPPNEPTATHAVPALSPAQLPQAPPFEPQALADSPLVQVPFPPPSGTSQQPPLQSCDAVLQVVVQVCVAVEHASPEGQSAATLQPHVPDPALWMQAVPAPASAAQVSHVPPAGPQALPD
jgi:hypothetical protein